MASLLFVCFQCVSCLLTQVSCLHEGETFVHTLKKLVTIMKYSTREESCWSISTWNLKTCGNIPYFTGTFQAFCDLLHSIVECIHFLQTFFVLNFLFPWSCRCMSIDSVPLVTGRCFLMHFFIKKETNGFVIKTDLLPNK